MHLSPRCGAHARRTGQPCRNAAMANGRCRMHGGATPRGVRHGAFVHGERTIETIADRRKAAALHETATAQLFEAIRAQTGVARKLLRGLLRSEEAQAQSEAIKARIAAALVMRKEAVAGTEEFVSSFVSAWTKVKSAQVWGRCAPSAPGSRLQRPGGLLTPSPHRRPSSAAPSRQEHPTATAKAPSMEGQISAARSIPCGRACSPRRSFAPHQPERAPGSSSHADSRRPMCSPWRLPQSARAKGPPYSSVARSGSRLLQSRRLA